MRSREQRHIPLQVHSRPGRSDFAIKSAWVVSVDWVLCLAVIAGLAEREEAVIEFMLEGKSLRDAAHALQVSDSVVQHSKRHLGTKILEFMGLGIMVEIQRRPQWKNSIDATQARLACRDQRRHL